MQRQASASSLFVRARAFLPAILYMAMIAWFSAQPGHGIDLSRVPLRDKGVHFVEFAVLAILFSRALWQVAAERRRRGDDTRSYGNALLRSALIAIALTATWGYLDELHQAFVPGRTADRWDLLADLLGAIAGASVYFGVLWLRRPALGSR
jgi:hypothetical protein